MRDFLTARKDEIRFVYNFHCAGAQYVLPFNADHINNANKLIPDQFKFFQEFISEAPLPRYFKIGPASELLGFHSGGDAADWINYELGIPACEVELGNTIQIKNFEQDAQTSFNILKENEEWIELTFKKLGNQISLKPVGYKKAQPDGQPYVDANGEKFAQIELILEVQNTGLSDQIHDDIELHIDNINFQVQPK